MNGKNSLPETLTTDRLLLTAPNSSHVEAIALLANNLAVHQMMARLPFPYTKDDAIFFVDHIAPSIDEHCYAVMMAGSQFLGVVGLHFVEGAQPELGYWLGEPFWGHGYATEAATVVVDAAKAAGFSGLRSRALVRNARSRNVLRKLGFIETHEGADPAGFNAGKPAVFMRLDFTSEGGA
jgi:RimJ/RimL family protein N-acetyltransferase